jgi:hypothetical protein
MSDSNPLPPAPLPSSKIKKSEAPETYKMQRLKIKYDFFKWFCGTFIIGLFTALSTQIIKSHEETVRTREAETKYLTPLLTQYLTLAGDSNIRYDKCEEMAKFLSLTVIDEDYKTKWVNLYNYCDARVKKYKATKIANKQTIDSLNRIKNENLKLLAQVKGKDIQQVQSIQKTL